MALDNCLKRQYRYFIYTTALFISNFGFDYCLLRAPALQTQLHTEVREGKKAGHLGLFKRSCKIIENRQRQTECSSFQFFAQVN